MSKNKAGENMGPLQTLPPMWLSADRCLVCIPELAQSCGTNPTIKDGGRRGILGSVAAT